MEIQLTVRHRTALLEIMKYPKGYPTTFRSKSCKALHQAGLLIERKGKRGPSASHYMLTQKGRAVLRGLGAL